MKGTRVPEAMGFFAGNHFGNHDGRSPRAPNAKTKKVRSWGVFRGFNTCLVLVFGALGKSTFVVIPTPSVVTLQTSFFFLGGFPFGKKN